MGVSDECCFGTKYSPLDALRNQSAIPSTVPPQRQEQQSLEENPAASELDEIVFFRNVHIADLGEPITRKVMTDVTDDIIKLGFQAQIYYRNIVDRFPLLPTYLASRLTIANHRRAVRLKNQRHRANMSSDSFKTRDLSRILRYNNATMNSRIGQSSQLENQRRSSHDLRQNQHESTMPPLSSRPSTSKQLKHQCKICGKRFRRRSSLQTHTYSHTSIKRELSEDFNLDHVPSFSFSIHLRSTRLFAAFFDLKKFTSSHEYPRERDNQSSRVSSKSSTNQLV